MTDDKPDYAAIIKSRKPMPTLDLEDLRRRSAEATKATLVVQPAGEQPGEITDREVAADPTAPPTPTKAASSKEDMPSLGSTRVPLRFSVSTEEQRALRIRAAYENKSVPDLMREIITTYLAKQGRKP